MREFDRKYVSWNSLNVIVYEYRNILLKVENQYTSVMGKYGLKDKTCSFSLFIVGLVLNLLMAFSLQRRLQIILLKSMVWWKFYSNMLPMTS